MKTAIIGTGKFGEAIAKKLVKAGYPILLTNSRGAASLEEKAQQLGHLASPAELDEVSAADVIFLTVRWSQVPQVAKLLPDLRGKILVDVTNHFLDNLSLDDLHGRISSKIVQDFFPGARLVKALNHLYLKWMEADPTVDGGRRVAFISGDDDDAKKTFSGLLSDFGFQPVDLGDIQTGGKLQQAGGSLAGLNLVSFLA